MLFKAIDNTITQYSVCYFFKTNRFASWLGILISQKFNDAVLVLSKSGPRVLQVLFVIPHNFGSGHARPLEKFTCIKIHTLYVRYKIMLQFKETTG